MLNYLEQKKEADLFTFITYTGAKDVHCKKILYGQDGIAWGELGEEEQDVIRSILSQERKKAGLIKFPAKNGRVLHVFYQPIIAPPRIIILGGGHIGAALSRMASQFDYEIVVIDDRPSFADPRLHPYAHKVICEDFGRALAGMNLDNSDYVVVSTRGHRHDLLCLENVLGKEIAYIGMLGSKGRAGKMFSKLEEQGFSKDNLKAVHAPIGIPINALSEEEIALSIMAEITRVRRKKGQPPAVQKEVLEELAALEEKKDKALLVTVLETKGPTPRKAGAQMLVFPNGSLVGTVGGGCVEAEVRREALLLLTRVSPGIYQASLNSEVAAEEGMACGGIMTFLLEPFDF